MEVGRGAARRPFTTTVHLGVVDGIPSCLTWNRDGNECPLEMFAFFEFYESCTQGRDPKVGPPTPEHPTIPRVPGNRPSPRKMTMRFRVEADLAGLHAFAIAQINRYIVYECALVLRPERDYLFLASFLHCLPPFPTAQRRRNCYHLDIRRPAPAVSNFDNVVSQVVGEELHALTTGVRTPATARIGDMKAILASVRTTYAGGAVTHTVDYGKREHTTTWNEDKLDGLGGPDLAVAKDVILLGKRHRIFSRGGVRQISEADVRRTYDTLIPVCDQLLSAIASRRWPAFNTLGAAEQFVAASVTGDAIQLRAIASALRSGRRRPQPRHLALQVMRRWTGLTIDRLSRLVPV